MSDKLSDCPFCGSSDIEYRAMALHWVRCGSCGSEGPGRGNKKAAIDAWNRRASPAIPTVDPVAIIEQCAIRAALHSQYPVETDFDRGYEQARLDAARSIRTLKAVLPISESEDARDAARYRWLRSQTNCMHGYHFEFPEINTIVKHSPNTYAARFDAAIDAARKGEKS
ncbi:Lar family restriction alleviation protein [Burkholderia gladioli]|uniref:Lar family restriction alleviation protein n=1 Tax=Burkholderia gladioli TaxID=28095 RepID=UPI0034DAE404